jgi:large subunit ribosomal protein L10
MARPDKVAVVEEVRDKLRDADAAVLTEYRGLTVSELAQLRGTLRPSSTEYKVFKNSLARRAAEAAGLADLLPYLEGPVAIAFVHGDAVVAAKALRDFGRTNPALVIKGGLLGPRVLSGADVESLAEIEPRVVLLARLAGGFQAPLTKAAGLFQAFTRNLAYGVQAYIDQRVAAGEPAPAPDTGDPEATIPETTGADPGPPPAPDEAATPAAAEAAAEAPSGDADTNASETQDPATPDDAESEEN